MTKVGSLHVDMRLESAQFIAGLKTASASANNAANAVNRAMSAAKGAVVGLASVLAVDMFAGVARQAFDYADAIVDLAARTGATTSAIQEFRYAAQLTGSSVESADAAVGKFAKNLGAAAGNNKAMAATLAEIGVTSQDVDVALRQAIDGISKLPSTVQKNATAVALFGKSAADLTTLLGGGSKAFDDLAERARKLGIVLDDQLLRNAGKVNDELDTLKMILDARMASAIVKNADGIAAMAGSMADLVGALASFWGQNPQGALAIMGAMAGLMVGARMGGGWGALAGAGLGAAGGYMLGNGLQKEANARNQQLFSGNAKWQAADRLEREADRRIAAAGGNRKLTPTDAQATTDASAVRARARARAQKARLEKGILAGNITTSTGLAGATNIDLSGLDIPTGGGSSRTRGGGGAGGKSPEQLAAEAARRLEAYERDLERSQSDYLRAQQDLAVGIVEYSTFEREMLEQSTQSRIKEIQNNEDYTDEQKAALIELEKRTDYLRADAINRRENEQLADESLQATKLALQMERDALSGRQSLARTQAERRDIALKLVELGWAEYRAERQRILESKSASPADIARATAELGAAGAGEQRDKQSVIRDTMGPLEAYLDSIPASAAEMREALENAAVNGIGSLTDGLLGVIDGTKSASQAFSEMANSIIRDLIRIMVQKAIVGFVSMAFGGGFVDGSGLGASAFDSSASIINPLAGMRANGGLSRPGDYLVGERGPEVVRFGATANVIPNHALKAVEGRASNDNGLTVNFGPITSNDPQAIRRVATEAIVALMPTIQENSANRAIEKLKRPGL